MYKHMSNLISVMHELAEERERERVHVRLAEEKSRLHGLYSICFRIQKSRSYRGVCIKQIYEYN